MPPVLQFTPFASSVDAAFWQDLATKKLNVLKLSEASQPVYAYYATGHSHHSYNNNNPPLPEAVSMPARICVPAQGLDTNDDTRPPFTFRVTGTLLNTNTFEDFKKLDKNSLFQQHSDQIWQAIESGDAFDRPSVLSHFLLLTFADLKRYKFYYWFAFPALMPQEPWLQSQPISPIAHTFSPVETTALANAYQAADRPPFFLVRRKPTTVLLGRLRDWDEFYTKEQDEFWVGFADPSNRDTIPGWPLRNLLALLHEKHGIRKLNVLCYREIPGKVTSIDASRLLVAELPPLATFTKPPKSVGWERNAQAKLAPRMADLGPLMDPIRLADTAVDLNLKLMRWRVMPDLDLDKVKHTKCLLLGAGTLGCYVARCLLGWGIRHITFVDNGRVSFSNPVRQPLYTFKDCVNGGQPKAEAAAKSLLEIQPTVNSVGYNLSIPMPGHVAAAGSDDALSNDIQQLTDLIRSHDVVYLLTDSRESRWFPTLLATQANKLVINAALGFDTYLVMRHGSKHGSLGCYFCNDIVAPADSLTDRTLDQQCTVTRPGLAAIAGALGVELMVSVLQHKDGIEAAASDDSDCVLGRVPHQIRGFLGQFHNMLIVGQSYANCTGCSEKVIEAYQQNPLQFISKILRDPEHLEQVSGIAQMKAESDALLLDQDWGDEEEDDF
ncbi:hypothetical protein BDB00DRAFT_855958 [Zychaea mexicana]|uniref:uncharacterized protein n=1 Tax=Zychaea mexicana TaxID=64656 RepID=UPI0022FEEE11|nr:uncharacterized protein BDB00DRAFT_855958 [Zychaea mexicana]KAI9484376.1 hypothetical protein BDB00DRAFT_855958 [Zychaea mexicana]